MSYNRNIESFPAGICDTCLRALNRCQQAEEKGEEVKPREAWSSFKLEMIKVPRKLAKRVDCPCLICRCVKFNPIGVGGPKDIVSAPIVNVVGEKMECEIQPKVTQKGTSICPICMQICGPGIQHGCSIKEQQLVKMGRHPRGRSTQRSTQKKCKHNLSEMVGIESIEAQEQITSDVIKQIIKKKGDTFRLKLSKGGGKEGMGTEMKVGGNKNEYHPLPIEIFIEIKKNI